MGLWFLWYMIFIKCMVVAGYHVRKEKLFRFRQRKKIYLTKYMMLMGSSLH